MVALHGGDTWPVIECCVIHALDTVTDRKQDSAPQDIFDGVLSVEVNLLFHARGYVFPYYIRGLELIYAPINGVLTGGVSTRPDIDW